jgi:hypothetical protein
MNGERFNVTAAPLRGVSLGSASVAAGGRATVALLAGGSERERRINISYNASLLEAVSISGSNASWKVDARAGTARILMPEGIEMANLTFSARQSASNQTALLEVTATLGLTDGVRNGSISILPKNQTARKSGAAGILASIFALAAAFPLRRKWR